MNFLTRLFPFRIRRGVSTPANRPKFIFILSAMRSGSSLLQHIIAAPEFVLSGGETKLIYKEAADTEKLVDHLLTYNQREKRSNQIYLEKCVHPAYLKNINPIDNPQVKILFLIRQPAPALSSLLKLKNWPYAESKESALWYYEERFNQLIQLAKGLKTTNRAFFISYEDLIKHPNKSVKKISDFLDMGVELKTSYREQKWTAKLSLGDVSPNIRKSKIIENKGILDPSLTSEELARLDSLYQNTKSEIKKTLS